MTWPTTIIGGANIHIFAFTDLDNNIFQKKLMMQNMKYEYSPLQLSTLATPQNIIRYKRELRLDCVLQV